MGWHVEKYSPLNMRINYTGQEIVFTLINPECKKADYPKWFRLQNVTWQYITHQL